MAKKNIVVQIYVGEMDSEGDGLEEISRNALKRSIILSGDISEHKNAETLARFVKDEIKRVSGLYPARVVMVCNK